MMSEAKLRETLSGKNVLYVATKNSDYIRVVQEIDILQSESKSLKIIAYPDKSYFTRVCKVFAELFVTDVKKYDLVVIGFMAQMIMLAFPWKFRKSEIITDLFISIYDTLVFDRKKIKEDSLLAKLCKWIDETTIRKSTYLIVDTKTHGEYFCEELGAKAERIFVCYLKADQSIYYPRTVEKPAEYKDKFVVLYFGSILPVQGVDVVMDTIREMADVQKVHFIIVGPIGKKISKAFTENVTYINWLKQTELAKYIAFSDLCLAGHFSSTVNKAKRTIPGKAYIYQAMGKKMILGDSPANRELYEENNKVLFCKMGSSKELKKKILKEMNG